MSMQVACVDLHKAKKERMKGQRKAERDEKAKKAREGRRQKKEAEQLEQGEKEMQRTKADALPVEVVPFTAPTTLGSQFRSFQIWEEAKVAREAEDTLLSEPFIIHEAQGFTEFLDSQQCVMLNGKLGVFRKLRRQSAVKATQRTQSRAGKGTEPLLNLVGGIFNQTLAKNKEEIPENIARLTGVAMYGVAKGARSFQPDYMFMNSTRYTVDGDRAMVVVKADDMLR
jgi:hypothetical protein